MTICINVRVVLCHVSHFLKDKVQSNSILYLFNNIYTHTITIIYYYSVLYILLIFLLYKIKNLIVFVGGREIEDKSLETKDRNERVLILILGSPVEGRSLTSWVEKS